MSDALINNIKVLRNNLDTFKKYNYSTTFTVANFDKFNNNNIFEITFKGKIHFVINYRGIFIPEIFISKTERYFEQLDKLQDVLYQKISKENYKSIKNSVKDIVNSIINPESDYTENIHQKLDLFFFICLTAEFYKQAKNNKKMYYIFPKRYHYKQKNYLLTLLINNL
jgi:hypothetical protein